jgi:hypothetical protein
MVGFDLSAAIGGPSHEKISRAMHLFGEKVIRLARGAEVYAWHRRRDRATVRSVCHGYRENGYRFRGLAAWDTQRGHDL